MKCKAIATALELLKRNNWKIKEEVTTWSEVDLVIYFDKKLTDTMRAELKKLDNLDYEHIDQDLHYAKEEIFICNNCKKIGLSFPLN